MTVASFLIRTASRIPKNRWAKTYICAHQRLPTLVGSINYPHPAIWIFLKYISVWNTQKKNQLGSTSDNPSKRPKMDAHSRLQRHTGRPLLFWSLKGGETDSLSRQSPDPVDLCWRRQTGGARTGNPGSARTFLALWRCYFLHAALPTEDIKQSRPASEVTASSQRCAVDYKEPNECRTSFRRRPSGTRATSIVEKWDYFVAQ